MEKKAFKALLKKETPKQIIYLHTISKIYLTNAQLSTVIKIRDKSTRQK